MNVLFRLYLKCHGFVGGGMFYSLSCPIIDFLIIVETELDCVCTLIS